MCYASFMKSMRSSPEAESAWFLCLDFSTRACRPPFFRALARCLLLELVTRGVACADKEGATFPADDRAMLDFGGMPALGRSFGECLFDGEIAVLYTRWHARHWVSRYFVVEELDLEDTFPPVFSCKLTPFIEIFVVTPGIEMVPQARHAFPGPFLDSSTP